MDLWLIAATAITKHLRNVSKSKEESSSCSEDFTSVKVESPRCLAGESVKPKEESFVLYGCGNAYGVEVDSSNDEIVSDWFRNRAFLRRNRRLIKPFSVKRSRLRVEEMSTEEYMCSSPFPSPCRSSVSRPLIVTDGTKVISKNVGDCINQKCGGIPRLRKLESSVLYAKRVVGESKGSNHRIGSNDAVLILWIGISIGIMSSSFVLKRTEANKAEPGLKLEDKDSSTVKDDLNNGDKQGDEKKTAENSESISEIEAELEAELERLEINMNSSDVETRLPDDFELEPDFEVEFAQGELREDKFRRRFDETESNQEPSDNSTPESGNYAVSPRKLSLRIHELITSRYEKRIKELEIALQESQRKLEQLVMESEEKTKPLSSLRGGGTHHHHHQAANITKRHEPGETIQPLVMDLTGEALEAFNETYEELMDINDYSEEELSLTSKSSPWSHKDEVKNPSRTSEDVNVFMMQDLLGLDDEEEENEMEKELIKQIVEKTKLGSSAVLNAQKMLFLMEETEQSL